MSKTQPGRKAESVTAVDELLVHCKGGQDTPLTAYCAPSHAVLSQLGSYTRFLKISKILHKVKFVTKTYTVNRFIFCSKTEVLKIQYHAKTTFYLVNCVPSSTHTHSTLAKIYTALFITHNIQPVPVTAELH